jgi:hypothetical protein
MPELIRGSSVGVFREYVTGVLADLNISDMKW